MKTKIILIAILLLNANCYAPNGGNRRIKEIITKSVVSETEHRLVTIACFNIHAFGSCNQIPPQRFRLNENFKNIKERIAELQCCDSENIIITSPELYFHAQENKLELITLNDSLQLRALKFSSLWAFNTQGQFPK